MKIQTMGKIIHNTIVRSRGIVLETSATEVRRRRRILLLLLLSATLVYNNIEFNSRLL